MKDPAANDSGSNDSAAKVGSAAGLSYVDVAAGSDGAEVLAPATAHPDAARRPDPAIPFPSRTYLTAIRRLLCWDDIHCGVRWRFQGLPGPRSGP